MDHLILTLSELIPACSGFALVFDNNMTDLGSYSQSIHVDKLTGPGNTLSRTRSGIKGHRISRLWVYVGNGNKYRPATDPTVGK